MDRSTNTRSSCALNLPPQAPSGPQPIILNSSTFFQKQDWRRRKTPLPAPFSFPAELMGFRPASFIMGHKDSTCSWLEGATLWSRALCHPHPAVCSIFHLSQKADETGGTWGQPRISFPACDNRWCGEPPDQVLPQAAPGGGNKGCEGFRKSSVTCFQAAPHKAG